MGDYLFKTPQQTNAKNEDEEKKDEDDKQKKETAKEDKQGDPAAGIPAGEDVMLLPAADCLLAFGTTEQTAAPEPGEIVITSRGGASIALKNDGTVVINRRLMIDKEGNILS